MDNVDQQPSDSLKLPRISLPDLEKCSEDFIGAMKDRGFVILTDTGEGEELYATMMSEFNQFIAQTDDEKSACTSRKVYKSERGVPMWFCGFEGSNMREAFRVSTGMMDIGCWPSENFETAWKNLAFFLRNICDRCLSIALNRNISPPPDVRDDKSVSYAVSYPNNRGGQQEEGINIKEHFDPSLFVVEPVSSVAGLEVVDNATNSWICVEQACVAGKEFVVFAGKALETNTGGAIRATKHRVAQHPAGITRNVFIFEQKYADFYPPPAFDD